MLYKRIRRSILIAVVLVFAAAWTPLYSQFTGAAKIVEQFYPDILIQKANAHPAVPLNRQSAFAVFDQLPDSSPRTIIAAYSNGVEGLIRVIRRDVNGSASVAFESPDLGDGNPSVQLIDLDGDGVKEVIIKSISFTGVQVSLIYRWDGSSLVDIGPPATLTNAGFIDLNHDGTLELISVDDPHPSPDPARPRTAGYTSYKLSNGRYVLDRPILHYSFYVRGTGKPRVQQRTFRLLSDSAGPFILKVVSGERGGANRVSSAHVVLNGVEVLGPNRFNQQVEFIEVPVKLEANNRLQVTLEGKPGSKILITVEDTAAVQRAQQAGP